MTKKAKNQSDESMKNPLVKCQCKERAVKRPESLLRVVNCRKCGKVFRSNRKSDLCFMCERNKS